MRNSQVTLLPLALAAIMYTQPTSAVAENFSWLTAPVRMKPIKQKAEGYLVEGFDVTDAENKYTIICKVSNMGTPTISEWNGAMRVEEINEKPYFLLNNARGFSELKLKWAEACRKIVK